VLLTGAGYNARSARWMHAAALSSGLCAVNFLPAGLTHV
jgi:hypothetical protein